ncbi:MAG: VWA domain-containing protein [Gammaproteobacteria bacterium]|jgi:Ca-activated chloride channel family protein|nr:VWA domain-containing protein [Gammaproteobacteria bacterium]MDP6616809.1 VWA domain-containing protein [Gammaproteobacteria bacterium]MDP6695240.1 VWA domain-containing protein [Gammaproteobacteria bacterium]
MQHAAYFLARRLHKLMLVLAGALVALMACTTQPEQPGKSQAVTTPPPEDTKTEPQASSVTQPGEAAPPVTLNDKPVAVAPLSLDEIMVTTRKQGRALEEQAFVLHRDAAVSRYASQPGQLDHLRMPSEPVNRENYAHLDSNPIRLVSEHPVSTFSIDVDTGSYTNVRRMLNDGYLPPQDAVRVEELINYFSYNYDVPKNTRTPFSINMEVARTPWNPDTHLLQVGLKGFEVEAADRPDANLVFLIDVSGSMQSPDKLPLLKNAFRLLTKQLGSDDSISMVVYAGATGIILEPTPGNKKAQIMNALDQLRAGGRTNGAAGINLAYQMAEQGYIEDGINRVILATDGDFNVGTVNFEALVDMVEERRRKGISLTTLGFGTGNYNDRLMEQLADEGNGNYAYIDGLKEARKVLVEELSSTLQTIAKDVKIQVEFNPGVVAEYRLIGYENRMLRREDFNNDKIDAGEIGAGHTVTALYEISLVGSAGQRVDPLRYGTSDANRLARTPGGQHELAFVRLRFKQPDGAASTLIEQAVHRNDIVDLDAASPELKFAGAVAAFGQALRGGEYLEDFGYEGIRKLAVKGRANDPHGYRGEFISLVDLADSLSVQANDRVASR